MAHSLRFLTFCVVLGLPWSLFFMFACLSLLCKMELGQYIVYILFNRIGSCQIVVQHTMYYNGTAIAEYVFDKQKIN